MEKNKSKGILKRDYIMEKFVIDSDSIHKFEVMEDRRKIADPHVGRIHGALISGKNPVGTIIVNRRNGNYRVIDGNHRLESIKRFFAYKRVYREFKIECMLKIYTGLNDDEEKQVYTDEATRRNESHEDRLNLHKSDIIFWKLLQDKTKGFPCNVSIYHQKKGVRFRIILDTFYTHKSTVDRGFYPCYLRKEDMVEFAKDLLYDDFILMKDFVNFFQKVFGDVENNNVYSKRNMFIPLFDLFARNHNYISQHRNKAEERFARIMGKNDLLLLSQMAGREAQMKIRLTMLDYINFGSTASALI